MDERLVDIDLIAELNNTFKDVAEQLVEDEKRYSNTWKERGLVWNNQAQEERFYQKMLEYVTDWRDLGIPVPWTKVIGEAHIALVREKKCK